MTVLWVFLGGGAGSVARYLLDGVLQRRLGTAFPYGTLTVNLLGSFLLVLLMHVALRTDWLSPNLRIALTTGFLGGFTTYSTFNHDSLRMLQEGSYGLGAANLAITLFGCLGAGLLGLVCGRILCGA